MFLHGEDDFCPTTCLPQIIETSPCPRHNYRRYGQDSWHVQNPHCGSSQSRKLVLCGGGVAPYSWSVLGLQTLALFVLIYEIFMLPLLDSPSLFVSSRLECKKGLVVLGTNMCE